MTNFFKIKCLAIGLCGLLISTGCASSSEISKLPVNALIVDVRTPREFEGGHYLGAVNIPLDSLTARISEFGDKNQPIVVYCRSGRRSGLAKEELRKAGFTQVQNGGGLKDMLALPQKP